MAASPALHDEDVLLLHVRKNTLPSLAHAALEGARLTVITEADHAQRYADHVDVRIVESARDLEEVRRAAQEVIVRGGIRHIVAPFELGQPAAAYLRSYFGLPGPGFETVNVFTNKHAMKVRMAAAGLPQAPHRLAPGFDDVLRAASDLGWPVVVKPAVGGGSIDVLKVQGPEHFEELVQSPATASLRALDVPLVVEQYVAMRAECHCDGIVAGGRVVFAAAARYLEPLLTASPRANGSAFLTDDDPVGREILQLHARAVAALGLHDGVTHMEFFVTDEGVLAGEIACRPAGGAIPLALALQYGVNVWDTFLRTSAGRPAPLSPRVADGILVNYHLPLETGRITRISTANDVAAHPSVVYVEMLKRAGDVVPEPLNSSSASGFVFLRVQDSSEIAPAVEAVADGYVFELE